jgi:hypothetical protein
MLFNKILLLFFLFIFAIIGQICLMDKITLCMQKLEMYVKHYNLLKILCSDSFFKHYIIVQYKNCDIVCQ